MRAIDQIQADNFGAVFLPPMLGYPRDMSSEERNRMKATQLSPRQAEALEIIREHIRRRGVPPSRPELARAMKISSQGSVDKHLAALARKGWVTLHPSVERGIQLLREGVPVLGEKELPGAATGTPIVAEAGGEIPRMPHFDSASVPFEAKPDYFLEVSGDALEQVGFHGGDMLAVRREAEPREGDLVVARIEDEITVKRFHCASEKVVELQPQSSSPGHETIRIGPHGAGAEIVGVVVGAIIGTRTNGSERPDRREAATETGQGTKARARDEADLNPKREQHHHERIAYRETAVGRASK